MIRFLIIGLLLFAHLFARAQYFENTSSDEPHRFSAKIVNGAVFVSDTSISFSIAPEFDPHNPDLKVNLYNWRMNFINTSESLSIVPVESKKQEIRNKVSANGTFREIRHESLTLKNLWNNIDMELMINETSGNFKYQFILHPGANPEDIQWTYEGVDNLKINEFGEIELLIDDRVFRDTSPQSWVQENSKKIDSYFLIKNNTIGINVPQWEGTSTIVFDPELVYGSLIGSITSEGSLGYLAGYDAEGNIYGASTSNDFVFPEEVGLIENDEPGGHSIAIAKFNDTNGEVDWISKIGGSGSDYPLQIIDDGQGGMLLLVITTSSDFPQTHSTGDIPDDEYKYYLLNLNQDGHLAKSILVGATRDISMLGGPFPLVFFGGSQYRGFLELDFETETVTFSFSSNSLNLPTSINALQPNYILPEEFLFYKAGYIGKLEINSCSLQHATYVSTFTTGINLSAMELLSNGNIAIGSLVLGQGDFDIPENAYQNTPLSNLNNYVAVLSSDLSQINNSTYVSFEGREVTLGIDEMSNGNLVINLLSEANVNPIDANYSIENSHNHILGFSPDLTELTFHGTFGGAGEESAVYTTAFLVDKCDKIYVSGSANSNYFISNMNLTPDAFTNQGGFYMASFEPEMADISFATLLGGNHTDGGISTYDEKGVVYQGVCSVLGDPFLTTDNAWDDTQMGGVELGVYKIDFQSDGAVSQFTTQLNNPCAPVELQLNNHSTLGEYQWFLDDELFSSETSPSTLISEPGEHLVKLVTFNEESCNVYDTLSVLIDVPEPSDLIANWETTLSEGCDETSFSASFTGSNADELIWSFEGESSTGSTFDALETESGDYLVELTATDSLCMVEEVLSFAWDYQPGSFEVNLNATDSCLLPFEANFELVSQGLDSFEWVSPDGTSFENNLNFLSTDPGSYSVLLNTSDEDCLGDVQTPFVFEVLGSVEATTNTNQIVACAPDDFLVQGSSNLGDGAWIINGQTFDQDVVSGSWEESFSGTWSYIATNAATCNVSDTVLVDVLVSQAPSGVFSWSSPSSPCQEEWILELEFIGEHVDDVIWEVNEELYFGSNQSIFYSSFEEIEVNASASNAICPNVLTEQFNLVSLVGEESTLLIPNVITPNGDGLNDFLLFPADQLVGNSYSLQISNRWGQVVFESNNPKTPWRGEVEDGVYFYILKAQLLCEEEVQTYSGVVHVLR